MFHCRITTTATLNPTERLSLKKKTYHGCYIVFDNVITDGMETNLNNPHKDAHPATITIVRNKGFGGFFGVIWRPPFCFFFFFFDSIFRIQTYFGVLHAAIPWALFRAGVAHELTFSKKKKKNRTIASRSPPLYTKSTKPKKKKATNFIKSPIQTQTPLLYNQFRCK